MLLNLIQCQFKTHHVDCLWDELVSRHQGGMSWLSVVSPNVLFSLDSLHVTPNPGSEFVECAVCAAGCGPTFPNVRSAVLFLHRFPSWSWYVYHNLQCKYSTLAFIHNLPTVLVSNTILTPSRPKPVVEKLHAVAVNLPTKIERGSAGHCRCPSPPASTSISNQMFLTVKPLIVSDK